MAEKRITKKKETGGKPKAPEKPKVTQRPKGAGGVTIVSGPMVDTLSDLVGMKVSEAADTFGPSYGAAPGSTVLVNGKELPADTLLSEGDTLEFVRRAGEKGVRQGVRARHYRQLTNVVHQPTEPGMPKQLYVGDRLVESITLFAKGGMTVKCPPQIGWDGSPVGNDRTTVNVPDVVTQRSGTGINHPWMRQHLTSGVHDTIVVECPPHPRTVQVSRKYYRGETEQDEHVPYQNVFLAFPWVVLVATLVDQQAITGFHAYYRNSMMKPGDTELCMTNLLNVTWRSTDNEEKIQQHVCIGETQPIEPPKGREEDWTWYAVEEIVHRFFRNGFNGSASEHMWNHESRKLHPKVSTFKRWEKASREDPSFITEVPWRSTHMTLPELLGQSTLSPRYGHTQDYVRLVARDNADAIYAAIQRGR